MMDWAESESNEWENLLEDKSTGPIMQHQLARNSKWQTSAENNV